MEPNEYWKYILKKVFTPNSNSAILFRECAYRDKPEAE
jgi:hypothetical protein